MSTLRLILGDQLSDSISSLDGCDSSRDIILMCEVWNEATYVKHHKKKIAFLFSAMRHFAEELMSFQIEDTLPQSPIVFRRAGAALWACYPVFSLA